MSELFPEVDESVARRLLRDGIRVQYGEPALELLPVFAKMGILTYQAHEYVRCSFRSDDDFVTRDNLDCDGRVEIQTGDREYYCPECGQPIVDIGNKTVFMEYEITLKPKRIVKYLNSAFRALDSVSNVTRTSRFSFQADVGANSLNIVLPEYSDERALYQGIFFGESTLYVIISPINQREPTALANLQHLALTDFLGKPKAYIEDRVVQACVSIPGRTDLSELESRFEQMLGQGWQYFEGNFVPAFFQHISRNPELCQSYLKRLQRLSSTIFGHYHVPIGAAGKPDLVSINKYNLMNQVLEGGFIGDAKCYKKKKVTYKDVTTAFAHLGRSDSSASVIVASTDEVVSTAWDFVLDIRENSQRPWKIIILTRYLILELLSELEATHLLDM